MLSKLMFFLLLLYYFSNIAIHVINYCQNLTMIKIFFYIYRMNYFRITIFSFLQNIKVRFNCTFFFLNKINIK